MAPPEYDAPQYNLYYLVSQACGVGSGHQSKKNACRSVPVVPVVPARARATARARVTATARATARAPATAKSYRLKPTLYIKFSYINNTNFKKNGWTKQHILPHL